MSLNGGDKNNITSSGDGSISSSGCGTATLWVEPPEYKDFVNRIAFDKAMFVPSSDISLLSVWKFDKAGCRIEFFGGRYTVTDAKTNQVVLIGAM